MNASNSETPIPVERPRVNWILFAAVLFTPIVASCFAGALDSRDGGVAPCIAVFGGAIAGIIGGAMLGRRLGQSTASRITSGILLALVFAVACIGASCFGCLASGYQFSMH